MTGQLLGKSLLCIFMLLLATSVADSEEGFTSVSAGENHTCGVRDTGTIECWGKNDYGQSTPPGGTFASVAAGYRHTCGLRDTGAVECWGYNE